METKNAVGRPSDYTPELASRICEKLTEGWSVRKICREEWAPNASSVFLWLFNNKEFSEQYTKAKEAGADAMQEDLAEIADEAVQMAQDVDPKIAGPIVQAMKLKADNMKWSMARQKPKKYGDKLDVTSGGEKLPAPIYGGHANKV